MLRGGDFSGIARHWHPGRKLHMIPFITMTHLDMTRVAAALGGRDQGFDMRPFSVGQTTRISQFAAVATSAVLQPSTSVVARCSY